MSKVVILAVCAVVSFLFFPSVFAQQINCSEAYGGKKSICEKIKCDSKYESFIGIWSGSFESYSRELSSTVNPVFRPFVNTVSYSENDCLRNTANGEIFIIGRREDVYPAFSNSPAKTETGLLITGRQADGTPFLRTVDQDGLTEYRLIYKNDMAVMSIWGVVVPESAGRPEMRFTVIDGRDFTEASGHKRNVTVTMSIGPVDKPFWEGVVSKGSHARQEPLK